MADVLAALLILGAGGFACIAAIGVLRFPDALSRMHATAKVGTIAALLSLLAAGIAFQTPLVWAVAGLTFVFLLATTPVATHLLARSARKEQPHVAESAASPAAETATATAPRRPAPPPDGRPARAASRASARPEARRP